MKLKCNKCGNTERFTVCECVERHEWLVDGDGSYIEDLDCYDSQIGDDFKCVKCSEPVKEIE